MTILLAILAFIFFITIHELGHFLAAKMLGMRVLVFSIGFGARILEKRIGNTIYAVGIIPLGGYVRIFQRRRMRQLSEENARRRFSLIPQTKIETDLEDEFSKDDYDINNFPPRHTIVFLLAGPLANLLLAFTLCWGYFAIQPKIVYPDRLAISVLDNSPAQLAGLKTGDIFLRVEDHEVESWDEFVVHFKDKAEKGEPITYGVLRKGEDKELQFTITPKKHYTENLTRKKSWWYGYAAIHEKVDRSLLEAFTESTAVTTNFIGTAMYGVGQFGYSIITGEKSPDTESQETTDTLNSGGIAQAVTTISSQAKQGFARFLMICFFYNMILCLFNLLPIPGLDGGQLISVVLSEYLPNVATDARIAKVNRLAMVSIYTFSLFILVREAFYFVGYWGI